ncbi:MAG: AEC family transporter [Lachnospiraceae bacterium]|nr:AEC family transporter [Lachnospiraceae bacterium]
MSAGIVFSQMLIIFALMLIGLFLCKKGIVSRESSKDLSGIVVNICSPMQLIMSVLNHSDTGTDRSVLIDFFVFSILAYIILIVFGYIVNYILQIPPKCRGDYHLMTIFGNCGFIGIPVAQALLGQESLIYVAVFNLCYNLFMYTYGLWIITSDVEGAPVKDQIRQFVNPGTVACVVTILIFWFRIQVPEQLQSLCSYAGQPATFLALVVIGISLSEMNLSELITDRTMFLFTIVRFVLFPIIFVSVLKLFIEDALIRGTMALMIAVPVGNMPAMMRAQYGQDDTLTAKGAVVTTVFSVITITITCLFV